MSRAKSHVISLEYILQIGLLFPMPHISLPVWQSFQYGAAIVILTCVSCSSPSQTVSESEEASANAALAILSSIQMNDMVKTFDDELSNWSYTAYDYSEDRNSSGYQSYVSVVNIDEPGLQNLVIGTDSTPDIDLSSTVSAIIPDDPPYLLPRFIDQYSYHINQDTSYWSRPAKKITIRARQGSRQDILSASYVYDNDSNRLLSLRIHNLGRTVFLEESSHYLLELRPIGREWVPHRLGMHIRLTLPLGRQQIFARNISFYGYTAL